MIDFSLLCLELGRRVSVSSFSAAPSGSGGAGVAWESSVVSEATSASASPSGDSVSKASHSISSRSLEITWRSIFTVPRGRAAH